MQSAWYETFFQGLVVDLWRQYTTPEMTRGEVDFFEKELCLDKGNRVLDVACGDGRHSVELAARGYQPTGLDISADFLAAAKQATAQANAAVEWIHGDMRRLPAGPFHGAFCFGNSFGYLEHEDTLRFFDALRGSLAPKARFLLETGTAAEALLPHLQSHSEYTVGDIQMIVERKYRVEDSRIASVYTFKQDGRTESHALEQSVYTSGEIGRMLSKAGFQPLAFYGGSDGSPFTLASRNLLVVAQKRE
ncbi:MAG TPA: class I SAM-dependent methyltransferase [Bryobacteraceae bacterium]|nr:class I SAM-dependent methyltransferase [Bryobacteraceae bacterium]